MSKDVEDRIRARELAKAPPPERPKPRRGRKSKPPETKEGDG